MRNPCAWRAAMMRCAVGLVSPVASAIAVNERAPASTASSTSTARSSTPTPVSGAGRLVAGPPWRRSRSSARRTFDHASSSTVFVIDASNRLLQWCSLSGTEFHYLDVPYQGPSPARSLVSTRTDSKEAYAMPKTLAEKIWEQHVVRRVDGEPDLLYIDLHLVHEVTSPQAFDGLRMAGRPVRRPDLTVATMDHNVPTTAGPVTDAVSARQMKALQVNADAFGITLYPWGSGGQGIVHVIGPEQGYTQPGMTIVCGDSHTSTHGAFGALAFGIGTSEVEHVLATQTLPQSRPKWMAVTVEGELPSNCSAKDIILYLIGQISTSGGVGYCVEYTGEVVRSFSMENRMTVCNMSIEGGARAGLIAPDDTTYEYLRGRPHAPQGAKFDEAVAEWRKLPTDIGAKYDKSLLFDGAKVA